MLIAIVTAGAGFLLAVLWFDLMFDVQIRNAPSEADLSSIRAYYKRVTTDARPMNTLIALVMLVTLTAIGFEIARSAMAPWRSWVSLGLAASAVGLALGRTVRNAGALGRGEGNIALARRVLRDHQYCFVAMAAVLGLQLTA